MQGSSTPIFFLSFCSSTSRKCCPRRQARRGFLLSTLLLGLHWTMNEDVTQNPNSGEARHAARQSSRLSQTHDAIKKRLTLSVHLHSNPLYWLLNVQMPGAGGHRVKRVWFFAHYLPHQLAWALNDCFPIVFLALFITKSNTHIWDESATGLIQE